MSLITHNRLVFLKIYLRFLGIFVLFWWPMSHWFYPEWYHRLEYLNMALSIANVIILSVLFPRGDTWCRDKSRPQITLQEDSR